VQDLIVKYMNTLSTGLAAFHFDMIAVPPTTTPLSLPLPSFQYQNVL